MSPSMAALHSIGPISSFPWMILQQPAGKESPSCSALPLDVLEPLSFKRLEQIYNATLQSLCPTGMMELKLMEGLILFFEHTN